jgi:uncharacterized protein YciI
VLYLVLAFRTPDFQDSALDAHIAFLGSLRANGSIEMAGAFTDKTGGAYLLRAANLDEARSVAFSDPLHTTGASRVTVHEWKAS